MSTRDTIAEILARAGTAARTGTGPARDLACDDHAARRAAILTETDETMLARALQFHLGETLLTLEARGRRLLRVTAIEPADERAGEIRARLDAGKLKPEEECALLAELVHRFAETDGPLSVTPAPSELPPSAVEKGHALAEMTAALPELAPAPAARTKTKKTTAPRETGESEPGLRGFLAAAQSFASSAALADADGKPAAPSADKATQALARNLARGKVLQGLFLDTAISGAKLIVLGTQAETDRLCLATDDGEGTLLVARIPPDALGPAFEAWRATHP